MLVCFFLPWLKASFLGQSGSISGYQMAMSANGRSLKIQEWSILVISVSMLVAAIATLASLSRKGPTTGLSRLASLSLIGAGTSSGSIILYHVLNMNAELNRNAMGRLMQQVVQVTYLSAGYVALAASLIAIIGGVVSLWSRRSAESHVAQPPCQPPDAVFSADSGDKRRPSHELFKMWEFHH